MVHEGDTVKENRIQMTERKEPERIMLGSFSL